MEIDTLKRVFIVWGPNKALCKLDGFWVSWCTDWPGGEYGWTGSDGPGNIHYTCNPNSGTHRKIDPGHVWGRVVDKERRSLGPEILDAQDPQDPTPHYSQNSAFTFAGQAWSYALNHTWYLSIFGHHRTIQVCKRGTKKRRKFATKQPKMAK